MRIIAAFGFISSSVIATGAISGGGPTLGAMSMIVLLLSALLWEVNNLHMTAAQ